MLIIGEKINATRSAVKKIISERNKAELLKLAKRQAAGGADYIDVNVATGVGGRKEEAAAMTWAVSTIARELDGCVCIDSADPHVITAGLAAMEGDCAMVNSVKANDENLKAVLPVVAAKKALLVALAMDDSGIPPDVSGRISACEQIAAACKIHGVSMDKVYFDPLVLPISADMRSGRVTLETLGKIKQIFPESSTVTGLSNVSYGLPRRGRLNAAFLQMAVYAGLDAAIVDPLDTDILNGIRTAEVLVGKDRHCRRYLRAFRK